MQTDPILQSNIDRVKSKLLHSIYGGLSNNNLLFVLLYRIQREDQDQQFMTLGGHFLAFMQ